MLSRYSSADAATTFSGSAEKTVRSNWRWRRGPAYTGPTSYAERRVAVILHIASGSCVSQGVACGSDEPDFVTVPLDGA